MTTIKASAQAYENWLREQIGRDFVEADLCEKHRKMRESPFAFLRATYWRWCEVILDVCPDLSDAPPVLAIGDTHLENFGTWRDHDGRLIWGVNDFDDAADMPYPLDLVRLAASAILARNDDGPTPREICAAILKGYVEGLESPSPFVLERDHRWLREAVLLPEKERRAFWRKFKALEPAPAPKSYRAALEAAMPASEPPPKIAPRTAGTGSLGRPRFVGRGKWNGGPVLREAKGLVPSAWSLHHDARLAPVRVREIATGPFRAPDPHFSLSGNILVRRMSPNSRKIDVEGSASKLLSSRMLRAMGQDIGHCHAASKDAIALVSSDLSRRRAKWLSGAAKAAARAITREYDAFK